MNVVTCMNNKLIVNNKDDEIIPLVKKRIILSQNGFLSISNNSVLESLSSLNKLNTIGGSLHIEHNVTLESLTGLENLTKIQNNLSIGRESFSNDASSEGNSSLTDLCAIRHLIINGEITENEYYIDDNAYNPTYEEIQSTSNICNQSNIYSGNLTLSSQTQIDTFTYTTISGSLIIRDSENNITNLNSLSSLVYVGGQIVIDRNSKLVSLNGLENIKEVKENLVITNNNRLTSLNGLGNVNSIVGYLFIEDNSSLISLEGLNNLTSINEGIRVEDNDLITSLNGLNSLISINENLNIYNNDNLINLCAVSQLITNGQITTNEYFVLNNAYNPTYTEIQNVGSGGCEK